MQHCTRQFLSIEFFIRKFIYEIRTKCHSNSYLLRNLIDKQKKDKKKTIVYRFRESKYNLFEKSTNQQCLMYEFCIFFSLQLCH